MTTFRDESTALSSATRRAVSRFALESRRLRVLAAKCLPPLVAWLDLNATTNALTGGCLTGGDAARLAVPALVWVDIPAAAGAIRVARRDVG
jgi:hypothetical protein